MSEWWSSLSIKNKLQIPIQLILLVVMIAAQRWAFDRYEMRVLEDARNRAVIPADGVFNGLNMMMLNGTISDVEQRKAVRQEDGRIQQCGRLARHARQSGTGTVRSRA